jgi:hypothetical protein
MMEFATEHEGLAFSAQEESLESPEGRDSAFQEALCDYDEMGGIHTATLEPEDWRHPSEEELQAQEAFHGEDPGPSTTVPEPLWEEFDHDEFDLYGGGPFIEEEPIAHAAEPAFAEDLVDIQGFFDSFDTEPEPIPLSEGDGPQGVKPGGKQEVGSKGDGKLENFASLRDLDDALRRIESEHVEISREDRDCVRKARAAVILAIEQTFLSRFNLGKALFAYKTFFKAKRGWMDAANIIAGGLHKCEKTVRNLITDYEELSAALPAEVIDAAELRGVDLARKKFKPAVRSVEGKVTPIDVVSEEQASQILDDILAFKTADKTGKSSKHMPWIKDFADLIVTALEELLLDDSPEEREAEVRFVLEYLNNRLCTSILELRQCGRPSLVSRVGSESCRSPRSRSKRAPALRSSSRRSRSGSARPGKLIQWPTPGKA